MNKETYCSAGVKYKLDDLFGCPDTLIRGRLASAYNFGCKLVLNDQLRADKVMDLGSCHGHGIKEIVDNFKPGLLISSDSWDELMYFSNMGVKINSN